MFLELRSELPGSGKSNLMYSAPTPSVFFAFDAGSVRSLYGSRWKLFEQCDIEVVPYPQPGIDWGKVLQPGEKIPAELVNWWTRSPKAITIYQLPTPLQTGLRPVGITVLWTYFSKLVNAAIAEPLIRSVGIDTATIMRKVAADHYLETLPATRVQLIAIEWGKPNDLIRSIYSTVQGFNEAYSQIEGMQKHFIITHHMSEEYMDVINPKTQEKESIVRIGQDGKPVMRMEGLSNTDRFIDVSVKMEKSMERVVDAVTGQPTMQNVFRTYFLKCGYDGSLEGTNMVSGSWDDLVDYIGKNVHPKGRVEKRGY